MCVGFAEKLSNWTSTTLKIIAAFALLVHVVLMNVTMEVRLWIIENGLRLIGFLPPPMERYDDSKASEAEGHWTFSNWFTARDEENAKSAVVSLVKQLCWEF